MGQLIEKMLREVQEYNEDLLLAYNNIFGIETASSVLSNLEKILPPNGIIQKKPNVQSINVSNVVDNRCAVIIHGGIGDFNIGDDGTLTYTGPPLVTSVGLEFSDTALRQNAKKNRRKGLPPYLPEWIHEFDHAIGFMMAKVPPAVPVTFLVDYLQDQIGTESMYISNLKIPNDANEKTRNLFMTLATLLETGEISTIPLDIIIHKHFGLNAASRSEEKCKYQRDLESLRKDHYIQALANPLNRYIGIPFVDNFLKSSSLLPVEKVPWTQ